MPTHIDIIIGRRIRGRRRLLCLTQQDLGRACGVSFQRVQKYEAASTRISVSMLWRVAAALRVNVDYFFPSIDDDARGTAGDTPAVEAPRLAA